MSAGASLVQAPSRPRTGECPDRSSYDERLERLGSWSGIVWVFFAAAAYLTAGLVPVHSPSESAADLSAFIVDHKLRILIGMALMLIGGYTFLITWSLTLAHQIRRYANPSRLAFFVQFAVGLSGANIGMLCGVLGTAMAYRSEQLDPTVIQVMYDLLWFLFLLPWPPFMLWQFVTGFAILSSANTESVFPRWSGYFTLWAGALEFFSLTSAFFYEGPFSYNGLVTFWVPGVSFFVWVLVMATVQVRNLPPASSSRTSLGAVSGSEPLG